MIQKTRYPRNANKRTEEQKEHDRRFAINLALKGFTQAEIADLLQQEAGRKLSRRQVGYDIEYVRERWITEQVEDYQFLVKQELARLNALEDELWESWRESKADIEQKRVEEVMRQFLDEEEEDAFQLMVDKVVTTTTGSVGDKGFLELIFKTQQERRKLLGLYAPAKLDMRVQEEKTLNIKGYYKVSPDDWPEPERIIEGEIADAG